MLACGMLSCGWGCVGTSASSAVLLGPSVPAWPWQTRSHRRCMQPDTEVVWRLRLDWQLMTHELSELISCSPCLALGSFD